MLQLIHPGLSRSEYEEAWHGIADHLAFHGHFTRAYSDGRKYVQLEAALLSRPRAQALMLIAERLFAIAQRATWMVQEGWEHFAEPLGLWPGLRDWVCHNRSAPFSEFVRIDFGQDRNGRLHVLELNSHVPGGLPEMTMVREVHQVYTRAGIPLEDPSAGLLDSLAQVLREKLPPGRAGFCAVPGHLEDYENSAVAASLRQGPAVFGGWPELTPGGEVQVSGRTVDGLYTYLPTEQFWQHPALLRALADGFPILNPGSAVISQSKAFLALLHHLAAEPGLLPPEDREIIRDFLPYTSVEPIPGQWVAKPYWAREGAGVQFGLGEVPGQPLTVYQRRVHLQEHALPLWTTQGPVLEEVTPILGVYLVSGRAAGILTRVGGAITDTAAHVLPTFVAVPTLTKDDADV